MANAEVYGKWSNIESWGSFGSGGASGSDGLVDLDQHAERKAWREAWGRRNKNNIRAFINKTIDSVDSDTFQVKIWVDQQICPTCQKWMIIDVIANLKLLSYLHKNLKVELYAEVRFCGINHIIRVKRSTTWPVTIGKISKYEDLPEQYI